MKKTYKKTSRYSRETTINETKKDKFIDKILENLELVQAEDWESYTKFNITFPSNLFTEKKYSGFNIIALFLDTIVNQYTSSKYATFNSISKAGGKLKKGSKGSIIEFFSYVFKDKETGKNIPSDVVKSMNDEQLKRINKIPCVKSYIVFNADLIENLSEINLNIENEEPKENELLEIENCENFISKIITKGNLDLRFERSKIAFYSPNFDFVSIPEKKYFISLSKYYSVLFHEIIHWTGNRNRLDRDLKGSDNKESYSFEELIAEMGAMLNCLQFGIIDEFINSVRYLKFWTDYNKECKEGQLRKAFSESKKAKKYLENL